MFPGTPTNPREHSVAYETQLPDESPLT